MKNPPRETVPDFDFFMFQYLNAHSLEHNNKQEILVVSDKWLQAGDDQNFPSGNFGNSGNPVRNYFQTHCELYLFKRMHGNNAFMAVLAGYYSKGVTISDGLIYRVKIDINYVKVKDLSHFLRAHLQLPLKSHLQ